MPNVKATTFSIVISAITMMGIGCATQYAPPQGGIHKDKWVADVDQPFANVWTDLIEYTSAASYSINHVERASGLVSLNFGAQGAGVDQHVDCGRAVSGDRDTAFTEFLRNRGFRTQLDGILNVFVRPIDRDRTRVRVTARYALAATRNGNGGQNQMVWNFDTGQSAEDRRRVCQPSYRTERSIIRSIQERVAARNRMRQSRGRR